MKLLSREQALLLRIASDSKLGVIGSWDLDMIEIKPSIPPGAAAPDHRAVSPTVPCFHCGVCCSKYQVHLKLAEAQSIAHKLGVAWKEFVDKYTDPRWPAVDTFLLRNVGGACVFLRRPAGEHGGTACLIQAFKPAACREWTASLHQPECQEGLARDWGLAVSPSGRIEGPDTQARRFYLFLQACEPDCQRPET